MGYYEQLLGAGGQPRKTRPIRKQEALNRTGGEGGAITHSIWPEGRDPHRRRGPDAGFSMAWTEKRGGGHTQRAMSGEMQHPTGAWPWNAPLIQSTFPIRLCVWPEGRYISYAHRMHATPVSHPLSVRVTDVTRDPRALFGRPLQAPAAECVMGYPREKVSCACQHRTIMHCSPNPLLTPSCRAGVLVWGRSREHHTILPASAYSFTLRRQSSPRPPSGSVGTPSAL